MSVEMKIKGLMIDPVSNMPIIILKNQDGDSVLPIWVGIFEANAIALQIENGDQVGNQQLHQEVPAAEDREFRLETPVEDLQRVGVEEVSEGKPAIRGPRRAGEAAVRAPPPAEARPLERLLQKAPDSPASRAVDLKVDDPAILVE